MGGELLILFVSHSIYMYGNNQLTPQLDLCHLLYFSPYLLNISCNCLFAPQSQSIIFTKIKPTKLHHIGPKKTISILLGLNPWLAQRKCIHLTFASIPCHNIAAKIVFPAAIMHVSSVVFLLLCKMAHFMLVYLSHCCIEIGIFLLIRVLIPK